LTSGCRCLACTYHTVFVCDAHELRDARLEKINTSFNCQEIKLNAGQVKFKNKSRVKIALPLPLPLYIVDRLRAASTYRPPRLVSRGTSERGTYIVASEID
jgi:hypothetical protein